MNIRISGTLSKALFEMYVKRPTGNNDISLSNVHVPLQGNCEAV